MQLPGEPWQLTDGHILGDLARPTFLCCLGDPVADAVDDVALVLARFDVDGACCFVLVLVLLFTRKCSAASSVAALDLLSSVMCLHLR